MIGTKVQNAYSSHMCPKYPKAEALNLEFLNTLKQLLNCRCVPDLQNGPSGTQRNMMIPPIVASAELISNTYFQENELKRSFDKWGKAVPSTKAPTKNPNDLPRPSSK